jgi:dienelactone hydrolase
VQQVHVDGELRGVLFLPAGEGKHPGVLVLGGSEGGTPTRRAAWLAGHGYAAFALCYFRCEGRPQELRDIALEYFGEALSWMRQRPEIGDAPLAVMGVSRGGELALQLGSMYPWIKAVVAYVPANVRYPSCCQMPLGASWTWKGQALAWQGPREKLDAAEMMRASIQVEHTQGPVLVIGGEDDGVWPSANMVDAVAARLRQNHFAHEVVVLKYAHAGHRAGMPEIIPAWHNGVPRPGVVRVTDYGGTPEGNAESSLDAIPKVLEFLEKSLKRGN